MVTELYPLRPLEELVDIYDSMRVPVKKGDRKPGPYPYYGASGIADYIDSYIFDGEYLLLAEDGDNLKTRNTPIAFMASGKFWVNNHAHILRANDKSDTRFLCYALQIADVNSYLSGSTRPKLTQGDMRRIPVFAPEKPIKKAIAHVLGALDDRIELNRRMNETLESMAQALFKSWFVDFDPVIDNALASGKEIPAEFSDRAAVRAALGDKRQPLPAEIRTLFPDEFIDSAELGWIPKGWEVGALSEIALLQTASIQPQNEPEVTWTHFSLPAFDEEKLPRKELGSTIKSGKYKVPPTAVLASKLNPQFPRVWLPDVENNDTAICSTEFMPFVPLGDQERPFLYAFFSSSLMQEEIANRATGSTGSRQRVRPPDIASMKILKPPQELRVYFSNFADSYYSKVTSNIRAARNLGKLRDTLLPKLLSGEVRIPEAEKMVEELAL